MTKNYTRVDNLFCMANLIDRFISCDTYPHLCPQKKDYLPIISMLELEIEEAIQVAKYNFRSANWEEFRKCLEDKFATVQIAENIPMEEAFYEHIARLDSAIKAVIKEHVLISNPSPYTKRWWTKNLVRMKKCKEQLARKSYRRRVADKDPVHEEFRQAWNTYSKAIHDTKRDHWIEWLETMDEEGLWAANRMVSGDGTDGGRNRILTLMVKDPVTKRIIKEARSNADKGKLLYQDFFPKRTAPPAVDCVGTPVQEKWVYTFTTDEQIHRVIKRIKPWKAT